MVNRFTIVSAMALCALSVQAALGQGGAAAAGSTAPSVQIQVPSLGQRQSEEMIVTVVNVARKSVVTVADARALTGPVLARDRVAEATSKLNKLMYELRVLDMVRDRLNMNTDMAKVADTNPPRRTQDDEKRDKDNAKSLGEAARALVDAVLANIPVKVSERNEIDKALDEAMSKGEVGDFDKVGAIVGKIMKVDGLASDSPKIGTGFSIGNGLIVTTADVLEDMQSPLVLLENGYRVRAETLNIDPILNIGILKLKAKVDLPALKLSEKMAEPGRYAVAVYNLSGQANTSALSVIGHVRERGTFAGERFYPSLIQIAGPVGPGASGAPLLGLDGTVVGMMAAVPEYTAMAELPNAQLAQTNMKDPLGRPNARITSRGQSAAAGSVFAGNVPPAPPGYPGSVGPGGSSFFVQDQAPPAYRFQGFQVSVAGFAIPSKELAPAIAELKTGQPIVRGWLGVAPSQETRTVDNGGIIREEAIVKYAGIYPDSPASACGLKPGDVAVSINSKPIQCLADVRECSVRLRPGTSVPVTVLRGGKEVHVTLKIVARPNVIAQKPVTDESKLRAVKKEP